MSTSPVRQSVFERHPRATLIVIVATCAALIDLAAGYVQGVERHRFEQNERTIRTETPYHHGLRPNTEVDGMAWGALRYHMATNSLGFKDAAPREVPLVSDRHRILFIGDSFTEGIGYPYEQTFVGLIGQRLQARGVEVLNAGVIGYSPVIYERKIRYLLDEVGLAFDELVVFIDISDALNDAETYRTTETGQIGHSTKHKAEQTDRGSPIDQARDFIATHTVLTYAVLNAIQDRISPPKRGEIHRRKAAWTYDRRTFEEFGERGLRLMSEHMTGLAATLAEHGIALTIVVYPWPDQIKEHDLDSIQVRHWRAWAREHGADFVNLFPMFIDDRPWETVVDSYYIGGGDVHFNDRGHAYVADAFLDHYDERDALESPK